MVKKDTVWAWAILALIIWGAFGASLAFGFILDDRIRISDNPLLQSGWGFQQALLKPLFPGNLFRPLFMLVVGTLWLTFHSPFPFHLLLLCLHTLTAIALFELLKRLAGARRGLAISALFAVHPALSEVVCTASGLAEILAALFVILSILCVITVRRGVWYSLPHTLGAAVCALLACAAKESAVVLPLLTLLAAWGGGRRRRMPLYDTLPSLFGVVAYLTIRYFILNGTLLGGVTIQPLDNPLVTLPALQRAVAATELIGRYFLVYLLVLPSGGDYSFPQIIPTVSLEDPLTATLVAMTVVVAALAALAAYRRKLIGFALLWFFTAMLATSNIFFPIGTIFSERLLYLPSIGLACCVARICEHLFSRRRRFIAKMLILSLLIFGSSHTTEIWRDESALLAHQREITPRSAKTWVNTGILLRNEGQLDDARAALVHAVALFPQNADAFFGLGSVAVHQKAYDRAAATLDRALALNPDHIPALLLRGRLAFNLSDVQKAVELFEHALEVDPYNISALNGLFAAAIERHDVATIVALNARLSIIAPADPEYLALKERSSETISAAETA